MVAPQILGNVLRKYEEPDKKPQRKKPKVKRKRKPMSEEQKKAAAERLKKAREAKSGTKNASLHESIRDLPDDHFLSPKKVKEWIKVWQTKVTDLRQHAQGKDRNLRMEYQIADNYVNNMKRYLQTGVWGDLRYGEDREHEVKFLVVAPAYYEDGTMKRTKGFFYRDAGFWGVEDET